MRARLTDSIAVAGALAFALSCAHAPPLPPHPLQIDPARTTPLAAGKGAVVMFANWGRFWDCAGTRNAQLEEIAFARLPLEAASASVVVTNPDTFHADDMHRMYVLEVDAGDWALDGLKMKVAQSITDIGHYTLARGDLSPDGKPDGGTFQIAAGEAVYLGHFMIDCAKPPPLPWRFYFEERSTFESFAAALAREYPALPPLQFRLFETTRFGTPFTLPP
jgi:hypothetical protein